MLATRVFGNNLTATILHLKLVLFALTLSGAFSNSTFAQNSEQPQLRAPWRGSARISQGNLGGVSHNECRQRTLNPGNCDWENSYALDIAVASGTEVLAPANGKVFVINSSNSGFGGRQLGLEVTGPTGKKFVLVFLHLSSFVVTSGQVAQGDVIAKSGASSGGSETGASAHLHFHMYSGSRSYDSHTMPIERLVLGDGTSFREYNARNGDLNNSRIGNKTFMSNNVTNTTPYEGFHDATACDRIYGWAWDRTQPERRVNVEIYDDSRLLATVPANEFRPDLRDNGIGDGRYAFSLPTPSSLRDGQSRTVRIKIAGTDFYLGNTHQAFRSSCSSTPTANISMSGCGQIGANGQTINCAVTLGSQARMIFDSTVSRAGEAAISVRKWVRNIVSTNASEASTASANTVFESYLPRFEATLGAGRHNISLEVIDEAGRSSTATATVVITETTAAPPRAVISMSSGGQTGTNGQTLNYTVSPGGSISMNFGASGSEGAITKYEWFSNGTFISGSPSFVFPFAAASHTITLRVTNSAGLSNTATATIMVTENTASAPRAVISMNSGGQTGGNGQTLVYTVPPGGSINMGFNASGSEAGTGNITNYEWRSNGTFISNLPSFTFPFAAASHTITLKVTNSVGLSNTATATIVVNTAAAPAISSISPASPTVNNADQQVAVSGSNFQPGLTVTVFLPGGGSPILSGTQIQNVTSNSFTMIVTLNLLGTYGIRVNNPNGTQSSTFNFSTRNPASSPQISSISPASPTRRDTDQQVIVSGSGFQPGLTVTVFVPGGGTPTLSGTQIQNVNSGSFTMIVTLNVLGQYGIRVNNPDGGQSNTFNFSTQNPASNPQISSISPASPTRRETDQQVTVSGSGFQQGLTVTVFYPGGSGTLSGTQIQNVNSASFTMVVTLNLVGQYGIRVNNPDGAQSNTFNFNVGNPVSSPQISSISPASPTRNDSDQSVTVFGSGFQPGLTVTVFVPGGGTPTLSGTQIQNVSSSSFTMIVTLNVLGTYGIRVNNPDGGQSNTFNFSTQNPVANPQINSISPASPTRSDSNQNVTVFGSGFQQGLTVTVFIPGGGAATLSGTQIQSVSSTSFTMVITLNVVGQYGIRVNNSNGGQSNTFNFQVQSASPTITSISPASPTRRSTDQQVTVFGTGFQSGLTVTVFFPGGSGTLSGTQIQSVTATSFTMIVTLNLTGNYSIRVNNPNGSQSNTFAFNVQ